MLAEKQGIKETVEFTEGLGEVVCILIRVFKDGAQLEDIYKIWDEIKDNEVKEALKKAWEGYEKIPAEVKDLDTFESVHLGTVILQLIPKILESVKK